MLQAHAVDAMVPQRRDADPLKERENISAQIRSIKERVDEMERIAFYCYFRARAAVSVSDSADASRRMR
jgi:hypothetical protein